MPLLLQGISAVLPARWYIQAVRKLMIEGVDISLVLTEVSILAVMAVHVVDNSHTFQCCRETDFCRKHVINGQLFYTLAAA